MPTRAAADHLRAIEQGNRATRVRETMGLTQDEFGALLKRTLRVYGVRRHYDKSLVSRIESGARKLKPEEAVVIAELDPEQRGIWWLMFGHALPPARESRP